MSSSRHALEKALELHRSGRVSEAAAHYRQILKADPRQADALYLLGLIVLEQKDAEQAAALFSQACGLRPEVANYHLGHARALRATGHTEQAQRALELALARQPDLADAHQLLGNILKAQRRYAEAVPSLREAARLTPRDPVAWLNLGVAYLESSRAEEALDAFRRAVDLAPERPDAWNVLGHALFTCGQATEAREKFERALKLNPSYPAAHDNLGRVARAQGEPTEALREFRLAVEVAPQPATQSNLLFALNFVPGLSPSAVAEEHFRWGAPHALARPATWAGHDFEYDRTLRVGFVSPDFVHHAVSFFFEPLLRERPREEWEVFCYSAALQPDAVTKRLMGYSDHWREIASLSDEAAEALVRQDKIDILIDLAGHSANNRLLLFARRVAPIQATWLGYPNTTGLAAMDYRITDGISDPIGKTDTLYAEKLLRLPRAFSSYLPPLESPPVNPAPSASAGFITFGSFNQLAKVNAEVVALWSRVLHAVPGSRLFLRSPILLDAGTVERLTERFGQHGIGPERLLFSGDRLSVAEHLRAYHKVDIALDPFPYNGTTTTCEALWMGAPVVTLQGASHVSRVGTSLLTHLGASEWIADSEEAYVAIAQTLAAAPSRLTEIRANLRQRIMQSPWGDAARFARDMAQALRQVWVERCRQKDISSTQRK